jgi:starch-binding outer membrane protein, SusD/RagB family
MKTTLKNILYKTAFAVSIAGMAIVASCTDDLNTVPLDEDTLVSEVAWTDSATYLGVLAKVYAGLTLSGNEGPSSDGDIDNSDQGNATFTRGLWNMEELSTDEAKNSWGDSGLNPIQFNTWGSSNTYVYLFFQRVMLNIAYANEYLRETTQSKLESRGLGSMWDDVAEYRDEARALRALNYYYLMDIFGNPPFITEDDGIGAGIYPVQIERADLFDWIESELLAIETNALLPGTDYSRMSLATVRTILAKMYLNAEVYAETDRYADAAVYCKKVIDAYPSGLVSNYANLFCGQNDNFSQEIIFGLPFDAVYATCYGGTTYIMAAAFLGDDMAPATNFGLNANWAGNRATQKLTTLFDKSSDNRYMFWETNRTENVKSWDVFKQGYSVIKFTNLDADATTYTSTETAPSFANSDFPLFRLADVYLMYAEALIRSGSTTSAGITTYFNMVRERAGVDQLTLSQITLDEILDERGRELYWEAHRRTDLIRFGKFLTGYDWPYKGGVVAGQDIDSKFLLFPIPATDLSSNPNLTQNDGY